MTDLEKRLIQAVCQNDLQSARKIAKTMLEADQTQKNRMFVKRQLDMLQKSSLNLLELPTDMKGLLWVEDVSVSFREHRYYLSKREQEVAERIFGLVRVTEKLKELGISYVNSTLLYGESGTGKTTFGKYIAYRLRLPFAYLNLSNILSSYLGSSQKNISKVFEYVRESKCVLMLDELDAIGMRRSDSKEVGEMSRVVISLMQNLDLLPNDVVLLGATNRKDIIDEALLRRFSIHHEIERLSVAERFLMAEQFYQDVGFPYAEPWLREVARQNTTQAQLRNKLVEIMVSYYTCKKASKNSWQPDTDIDK